MATRKPWMRWLIAATLLLLFVGTLVLLEQFLTLDLLPLWGLRIGLILLGLVAAGAAVWFLRPVGDTEPVLDPADDVLNAIGAARARLPRGTFTKRPLILVVGPEGGAKTTLVARVGGNPELLAGDAPAAADARPQPTVAANVWTMQGTMVTELAPSLLDNAPRWGKVLRALRAPRVAAAVGRGEAAPRAAVVCVPCDLFYAQPQGAALEALAQSLRLRLADAAKELGLALPVYVVFTKMDRIPNFEPWAGAFTREELRAPLGATLPFDTASTAGSYAERLTPRVERALQDVIDRIALRRLSALARESVPGRRYGSYELPRELQKLVPAVTRFLVDACRPTQVGVSPLLRGFYFVGARPVVVNDAAAHNAQAPAASLLGHALMPHAQPVAPAPVARKVPEWVFLDRLFRDVVLADTGAASVARGGVRVQRARRALLGLGVAAAAVAILGFSTSWLSNRALVTRVQEAASAVAALPVVEPTPGTIVFPSAEALRRLDVLRAVLDTVRQFDLEGPPLRLRLGLWHGADLLDAGRPVWYAGFRRQLFDPAWHAMVDSLGALSPMPTPSDDYGRTYGWLKAYLITTTAPERSTAEFLAPVLLASWQRGQATDADLTALARRQFEFYARDLPTHNAFPATADAGLVTRARDFLSRFTGGERIYQYMLAEGDKAVAPLNFTASIPQAAGVMTLPPAQPGSFTAKGATFMADAFKNSDRFFQGERWVVGDATASQAQDRNRIIAELRARYQTDYLARWRQVIAGTRVLPAGNVKDAAQKLNILGGAQSPLLALLSQVARNTAIDSATTAAFQPVHAVTSPTVTDKLVADNNSGYMNGLLSVQGALEQVGNMPPVVDTASAQAVAQAAQLGLSEVTRARTAARQLAQKFDVSAAAMVVGGPVEQLLLAPLASAEAALRGAATTRAPAKRVVAAGGGGAGAPAAAAGPSVNVGAILNERGRALCAGMTPMLAKFPFSPDAAAEASIAEVSAMLAPNTGALWAFQQERLAPFLDKEGGKWVAKPSGNVALSASFVDFFNKAATVSAALFADGATSPRQRWMARGLTSDQTPTIILSHGGTEAKFDKKTPRNEVVWPSESGRDARLEAVFKRNKPVTVASASGEWALFRLVAQAQRFDGAGHVEWNAVGKDAQTVVVEFDAPNGLPVLKRGWLGGMTCVAQVTQ